MNKRILIGLTILLSLSLAIWWVMSRRSKETLNRSLSDFAIKDTASITRIVLADKEKNKIELTRGPQGWMVNGEFPARPDGIKLLMETIFGIEVRSPVGRAGHNTVIRRLATKSTKIEVYRNESLIKAYYVGGPTQDQLGTYMLMEGSDVPFITGLTGFTGYLTPRYFTSTDLWKSPALFRLRAHEIASVKLISYEHPEAGWELINQNNTLRLKDAVKGTLLPIDTLTARAYLTRFYEINYEAMERSKSLRDSLLKTPPREEFLVTSVGGKTISLRTYNKKNPADETEIKAGAAPPFDPDRFWAVMNNDTSSLLLLQYFVLDPVMVPRSFFTVVKK
jgi:hypothetical protein